MTTLLVRFVDRNIHDETVECESWDHYSHSGIEWFRCTVSGQAVFQAQASQVLFFRVVELATKSLNSVVGAVPLSDGAVR